MDFGSYKAEFLVEVREHLDNLNRSLLSLEQEPDNPETINSIFRSFHTIKGNSAAMEFMNYSELAHKLEDVLDRIRNGKLAADKNVIDILLEGCDILDEGLRVIESENHDNISIRAIADRIDGIIEGDVKRADDVTIPEFASIQPDVKGKIEGSGKEVCRVILVFDKESSLKSAKAMLAIRALSPDCEIVQTQPKLDDLKAGRFQEEAEMIVISGVSNEKIKERIGTISGIKEKHVLRLDEPYKKRARDAQPEKEAQKSILLKKHTTEVMSQIRTVKIDIKRLDKLMNMVGELLINKMRMQEISNKHQIDDLKRVMKMIDRLADDIQNEVTTLRMVPIGNVFNRYPRMVRDLANKEGKNVELVIEGDDIEFDRTILDELGDPLVHLLRNCVDHGIESPEERKKNGKSEKGTIKVIAQREKDFARIIVSDDGSGIDPLKVKESCIAKGIISKEDAEKMDEEELKMLIFRPGASTNSVVTDISGRGVGMNTVLSKISSLGGEVKLSSDIGVGTTVVMQLPLTVSIINCLLFKVCGATYSLPLSSVSSTVHVPKDRIKTIEGVPTFKYLDKEIALIDLRERFGIRHDSDMDRITVIVVNVGNEHAGLIVDDIIAQQQVLIKKLSKAAGSTRGIAGCTILGDGTVSLVLDINALLH